MIAHMLYLVVLRLVRRGKGIIRSFQKHIERDGNTASILNNISTSISFDTVLLRQSSDLLPKIALN